MNSAAWLNVLPPSLKKIQALIPAWTNKKATRDKPVTAISTFRPILDVNRKERSFINCCCYFLNMGKDTENFFKYFPRMSNSRLTVCDTESLDKLVFSHV